RLRLALVDADPQPAAIGNPGHAQDPETAGRGRRQDRGAGDDVSRTLLRSSHDRWARGGDLPGTRQGMYRGPAAHAVRRLTLWRTITTSSSSAVGLAATSRPSARRSSA